jgi:hypothetical protein
MTSRKLEFRVTAQLPDRTPDWTKELVGDFARNATLQLHSTLTRHWPLIAWRVEPVTPNDVPVCMAILTPDPCFDPLAPVIVNGFRYIPAPPEPAPVERPFDPPKPADISPVPSWSTCRAGRREGDEYVCPMPGCGLRWACNEDLPRCPR